MKEFFSIEGPFMQFFGKLWDIIKCCILCVQYSDHYVWDELYCTVLYGCKGGSARGETCCADVFKNGSPQCKTGTAAWNIV